MNSQLKLQLFRMIKQADQFGAVYRPAIKQGQQQFKTVLGGFYSIILYGLSLSYFIYGIQKWATDQILPTLIEFNEVIELISYQQQQEILQIRPDIEQGKLDPFDKKNTILMLMMQQYQQGQKSSNFTRIKQTEGQFILQDLVLSINNLNKTDQEYYLFLISCQQQYLEDEEQCAEIDTIEQFWNQSNMMEIQLFSQKFNSKQRELKQLTREYFILYEKTSTYVNNLLLQTTITNVDYGILFPSIQSFEFVSDILQYSQTVSTNQFIKQFGVEIYLTINLSMDTQQRYQNISYPNLSQVLANIGSIISTLMLLSHIAIFLNKKILEESAKLHIIKIYFPEIKLITITKNWFGRIVSIKKQQTNETYDVKQFQVYVNRLYDIAEQKLSIKNQIYELSRMQFAIQQLLTRDDIIKLRDKHLKLLIKPFKLLKEKKVQEQSNEGILIQIDSNKESKICEDKDVKDEKDEIQSVFFHQNKSIQDQLDNPYNSLEQKEQQDENDFELLCQKQNVQQPD